MKRLALSCVALALMACASACSTAPTTDTARMNLESESQAAISRFRQVDPGIGRLMDQSYGYAVFPSVGKGGAGVGGAYGRGILYERGRMVGYCDLSQGTLGLQLGGQEYREVILLQDEGALNRFRSGEFALAAQATAVAAKEGASADAGYKDGVIVFTEPVGGLMFEASVGGQHFTFVPK